MDNEGYFSFQEKGNTFSTTICIFLEKDSQGEYNNLIAGTVPSQPDPLLVRLQKDNKIRIEVISHSLLPARRIFINDILYVQEISGYTDRKTYIYGGLTESLFTTQRSTITIAMDKCCGRSIPAQG